jgi:hypothetical protein
MLVPPFDKQKRGGSLILDLNAYGTAFCALDEYITCKGRAGL